MESLFDLNWSVPEEVPSLESGEAHIWCATIDQPLSVYFELKALLSVDEQVRASRFRNEQSRKQYVLGRGLLRKLLGIYLDEHPTRVSFVYGENGKPLLYYPVGTADVCFNVSHSGELVLMGFCPGADLGVDVEQVRPVPEADVIAERFFTTMEASALKAAAGEKRELFFKIWTRKEALLKCSGAGFGDSTSTQPDARVYQLSPAPGYVASVAIAGSRVIPKPWRWTPEIYSPRSDILTPRL